jgi:uncharacterized protein YjbI with pentapeptide repeats
METNLSKQDLTGKIFKQRKLTDFDFHRATCVETNFYNTYLFNTNFYHSNCLKASFMNSYIENSDFIKADLRNTNLENCFLYNVDFRGADLRNANLKNAKIKLGTDFRGADLRGADLTGTGLVIFQADNQTIILSDDTLSIPCKQYSHPDWTEFDQDRIESEVPDQVKWWNKNGSIVKMLYGALHNA